jgi:hypothetical protein
MSALDGLGYFAASLVLATFCARSMVLLRIIAIASNFAFIAYGSAAGLWPILALHTVMLPLNLVRLRETTEARLLRTGPRHKPWFRITPSAWPSNRRSAFRPGRVDYSVAVACRAPGWPQPKRRGAAAPPG